MKSNEKDPYNFEKIDPYLEQRKKEIGKKKQMYGKVYQKGPKAERQGPSDLSSQ